MKWVKDQKVEANLRALGVQFEVARIPVEKIDWEEGLRRQARMLGKLNDDAVLTMGIDMAKPDAAFPMIIVQKPPHGPFWPWSGNHRGASFRLVFPDEQFIDCYVVTIRDPVMLDLLPRVVNAWESQLGFSRDEKILNALWMVNNHSMAPAEAAKLFGLKVEWLYKSNQANETKKIIADIPKADGIPKSTLVKLHTLADNTNVLRAVVRLIVGHNIKTDEALHIISDVRGQDTENQKLGEVGRWEKILISRKARKKKGSVSMTRTVREQAIRYFTGLAKVLDGRDTLAKLQITDPADMAVVQQAWNKIRETMDKIEKGGK